MTKNSITLDEAIRFLNELVKTDQLAISKLLEARVPCSESLADHPTVQVLTQEGKNSVGILGVLNGLFGIFDEGMRKGWGAITAIYDEQGQIIIFERETQGDSLG